MVGTAHPRRRSTGGARPGHGGPGGGVRLRGAVGAGLGSGGEVVDQRATRVRGPGAGRHPRTGPPRRDQSPLLDDPDARRGDARPGAVHGCLAREHPRAAPRPRASGPPAGHWAAPDHRVRHGGGVRRAPGHRHLGGRHRRCHRGADGRGARRHHHGGPARPGPDPPGAQRRERSQRRHRHPVREPLPGRRRLHRGDTLGPTGCRRARAARRRRGRCRHRTRRWLAAHAGRSGRVERAGLPTAGGTRSRPAGLRTGAALERQRLRGRLPGGHVLRQHGPGRAGGERAVRRADGGLPGPHGVAHVRCGHGGARLPGRRVAGLRLRRPGAHRAAHGAGGASAGRLRPGPGDGGPGRLVRSAAAWPRWCSASSPTTGSTPGPPTRC